MVSILQHVGKNSPWDVASKNLFKPTPATVHKDILSIWYKPVSSFQLSNWILRYSSLTRYSKLLALELSAYYRHDLGYCFPNYEHLAQDMGISERTVGEAIKDMKLSGEWLVIRHPETKKVRTVSNRYYPLTPISITDYQSNRKLFNQAGYFNARGKFVPPISHSSIQQYQAFLKKVSYV
jgi:hypothetical protein